MVGASRCPFTTVLVNRPSSLARQSCQRRPLTGISLLTLTSNPLCVNQSLPSMLSPSPSLFSSAVRLRPCLLPSTFRFPRLLLISTPALHWPKRQPLKLACRSIYSSPGLSGRVVTPGSVRAMTSRSATGVYNCSTSTSNHVVSILGNPRTNPLTNRRLSSLHDSRNPSVLRLLMVPPALPSAFICALMPQSTGAQKATSLIATVVPSLISASCITFFS